MTPQDREQIRLMIAAAIQPIADQLSATHESTRKHSKEIKAVNADARRSAAELEQHVEQTTTGIAMTYERLLQSINAQVGAIDAKVETVTKSIAPAAEASKTAAHASQSAARTATDLVVGQTVARNDIRGARQATVAGIVVTLVLGVFQILANAYVEAHRSVPASVVQPQ